MITEATLARTKYPPELAPDAQFVAIPAGAEVTPPILDLRRLHGKLLRLTDIAVERVAADVEARIRYDDRGLPSNADNVGGFFDLASATSPYANNFQILARDRLYYNLFSIAAGQANYRTSFGLWIEDFTIASKIKMGVPLTNEEKAIDEKFGVTATVEKGLLPLPLEQQIEREYRSQIMSEETHGRSLAVTAVTQTIEALYPRDGEFLVLTKIAATPGAAADNISITINRDNDASHLSNIKPFAFGLDRELNCFIPAMSELSLDIVAAGAVAVVLRYTILKVKLTNIHRARFGLASADELPGDVWAKVFAGVL